MQLHASSTKNSVLIIHLIPRLIIMAHYNSCETFPTTSTISIAFLGSLSILLVNILHRLWWHRSNHAQEFLFFTCKKDLSLGESWSDEDETFFSPQGSLHYENEAIFIFLVHGFFIANMSVIDQRSIDCFIISTNSRFAKEMERRSNLNEIE